MSRNRKQTGPEVQDVAELIPPNFHQNSNKLISNQMFRRNINTKNPFTNPKWHPLLTHKPDQVGPNLRMERIDKKKLFLPDDDDVYHIENEVNYYRNEKDRNEQEITMLMENRQNFINEIEQEQIYEQKEQELAQLEESERLAAQKMQELKEQRSLLERANQDLEGQLNHAYQQKVEAPPPQDFNFEEQQFEPQAKVAYSPSDSRFSQLGSGIDSHLTPPLDQSLPQTNFQPAPALPSTSGFGFKPKPAYFHSSQQVYQQPQLITAPVQTRVIQAPVTRVVQAPAQSRQYRPVQQVYGQPSGQYRPQQAQVSGMRRDVIYNIGGKSYTKETLPEQYRDIVNS